MSYSIDKTFEFEYGHRVWSQTLNKAFSLDDKCICRHLHGHHGIVKIHLKADELKDGMVTDFKHLNCIKKFIDDVLDHKFLIDKNDPLFLYEFSKVGSLIDKGFYQVVDLDSVNTSKALLPEVKDAILEMYESYVIVDFVPTSENFCKWLFDISCDLLKDLNVTVSCVELSETPKTHCAYYAG